MNRIIHRLSSGTSICANENKVKGFLKKLIRSFWIKKNF